MSFVRLSLTEAANKLGMTYPQFLDEFKSGQLEEYIGAWSKKNPTQYHIDGTSFNEWLFETLADEHLIEIHDASAMAFGEGAENILINVRRAMPAGKPFPCYRFVSWIYCRKDQFLDWWQTESGDGRPFVFRADLLDHIAAHADKAKGLSPEYARDIKEEIPKLNWHTEKVGRYEWYQRTGCNSWLQEHNIPDIPERTSDSAPISQKKRP